MGKKGLGRGLEALIPGTSQAEKEIIELTINDVEPNSTQPRRVFKEEALETLAESIKLHGVVQPIIVTKDGNRYKIVAGERRWRAARIANLKTIPAIIKEYADKEILEVALIENIQRQDLNPIEEAEAFQRLIQEYALKQEEVAVTIGRSRSAVANSLRLLNLDYRVKEMVVGGIISEGHARVLLAVKNGDEQYKIAKEFEKGLFSVREAEKYLKKAMTKTKGKKAKDEKIKDIVMDLSNKLKDTLGTKVHIDSGNNKGKIVIEYFSNQELDRLIEMLLSLKS
ncbi:MAG: ParB/RepB/Spo0J family partition protein [Deltaproteobacteria bacterium]